MKIYKMFLLSLMLVSHTYTMDLAQAAQHGNLSEVLKKLVNEKVNPNVLNFIGEAPFIEAAKHEHLKIMRILIDAGADIDIQNGDGETALMWASLWGRSKIVKFLISVKANINISARWGTALTCAVREGYLEIARELIKAGADVNIGGALMWAAREGHLEAVRLLINAGAHLNIQDEQGDTALIWAARKGEIEIVKFLISAEADINICSCWGTALTAAAKNGHLEVVRLLINAGAHLNMQDEYGKTALTRAAGEGKIEIARELIKAGAKINIQDHYGETAFVEAIEYGKVEIARELIKAGADVNFQNKVGYTALMKAASPHWRNDEFKIEIIRLLLTSISKNLSEPHTPELIELINADIKKALKKIDLTPYSYRSGICIGILEVFHLFARSHPKEFPWLEKEINELMNRRLLLQSRYNKEYVFEGIIKYQRTLR